MWTRKNAVRFAHVLFGFISFYLFVLNFAMKLKNANHKSHWNNLVFIDQWNLKSNLSMAHGKISDFVSSPLFGFTLVIKLRNVDFESHWNTSMFFDKKNDVRFEYAPSNSVWSGLSFVAWVNFGNKLRNTDFNLNWIVWYFPI